MAIGTFIPTVWAARLLDNLDKDLVFAQPAVCNTDYEGDIKAFGDTVKIGQVGDITVSTYTRDTNLSTPQALTGAQAVLTIDQAKSFNFQVDDLDKAQQRPATMDKAMQRASYAIRNVIDGFIAALHGSAGLTIGSTASPITPTPSTAGTAAYEYLVDAGVKLNEQNVPMEQRYAIVPPWFVGMMSKDARFTNLQASGSAEALRNGMVGRAAGFDIYVSNNIVNTSSTKYKIFCGHPMAITYAGQLTEIEAYRMELRFADGVKGLYLYGAKVVQPNALLVMTANPS